MAIPSDQQQKPDEGHVETIQWLEHAFHSAGREVPGFDRSSDALEELTKKVNVFRRRTEAMRILANDMQARAEKYYKEAERVKELVETMGLGEGELANRGRACASDLAEVADALQINDAHTSSYLVGMARLSLEEGRMEERQLNLRSEKRALQREVHTAGRLRASLEKVLRRLKEGEVKRIMDMERWTSEMEAMTIQQEGREAAQGSDEDKLQAAGFSPSISHGAIVKLAEERQALEDRTQPVLEGLRTYHDLPPDLERAELIIRQKEEEFEELRARFDEKLGETLY